MGIATIGFYCSVLGLGFGGLVRASLDSEGETRDPEHRSQRLRLEQTRLISGCFRVQRDTGLKHSLFSLCSLWV